ncbi:hypothetical protein B0H14DRAFT_3128753 [Mycena olivaceomarginata]|nr:hypothetical protein B0H14DRAFT_3143684 [Mycena olivaceomarginata]KAJ7882798.1 hypothetical protein B0H14DRAFT_3128753 [Mycena olivaceomarginata]
MQSSDSSDFGFNFPNLNHRDYASNLFGWELPQAASIQQDFGVSNPFVGYDPISLENLHQRLLWVETTILGWQMLGGNTTADGKDVQGIPSQSVQPELKRPTDRAHSDQTTPLSKRTRKSKNRNQRKALKFSRILAERRRGRGKQYQVLWDEADLTNFSWLAGTALKAEGAEVLYKWEKQIKLLK